MSGPLLDRVDLHVEVPAVPYRDLTSPQPEEPSTTIRARVETAREIQRRRFKGEKIHANAQMRARHLKVHAHPSTDAKGLLETAMQRLGLSARAYSRILKVARTIADLAGAEAIGSEHVSEAIQYRALDRS